LPARKGWHVPLERQQLHMTSGNRPLFSKEQRVRIKHYLRTSNLKPLLIEEFGWDRPKQSPLSISLKDEVYILKPLTSKRSIVVYECSPDFRGNVPLYHKRSEIEKKVKQSVYEHVIIYLNAARNYQIWQWVERFPGGKQRPHEHHYYTWQDGEAMLQKLQPLFVSLEEEEQINVEKIRRRIKKAFGGDPITKSFFEGFKVAREKFLAFVKGIPFQNHREWYTSVMLSRLMIVYFIQKKGFLDGDEDYLSNHLQRIRRPEENGTFLSFYRTFLLRLFHEALGRSDHSEETEREFGFVPYLNGGLFEEHQLEEIYSDIQIANDAFEEIFTFFGKWRWHLSEGEDRNDNEISPDVLGYIFEQLSNENDVGIYYTKEDITGYIARNTIIPRIFDAAEENYRVAFQASSPLWQLLRERPDRYFYQSVKKGVDRLLPLEIAAGERDVAQRHTWNNSAQHEYALPTEIWREVVARRKRHDEIHRKLTDGVITAINDFITYNLDISLFALDVIKQSQDVELIYQLYIAISQITILDPTCGSGAFLLAAINILKPLYDACLERMREMVQERDQHNGHWDTSRDASLLKDRLAYFRDLLDQVTRHPDRDFFVLKSIVMNNLYGVDLMQDVVEICKVRLFLKLLAQIDEVQDLETLPDVDFNIYVGNSLIGFATYDEVKRAVLGDIQGKIDFGHVMEDIESDLQTADHLHQHFQTLQTQALISSEQKQGAKKQLDGQLQTVSDRLDRYLVREYGNQDRPFHWFVKFYGIMKRGGFDVIIGNPPYAEYSKVQEKYAVIGYQTKKCGNIYAYVMERSIVLTCSQGRNGMIVQLPMICTDRMIPLHNLLNVRSSALWISSYDDRPAKLFDGLEHIRASIVLYKAEIAQPTIWTTKYRRWASVARNELFSTTCFTENCCWRYPGTLPKLEDYIEKSIVQKLQAYDPLGHMLSGSCTIYFHNAPQYWIHATTFVPYFSNERGGQQLSVQVKPLVLSNEIDASVVAAIINSSLFYWWFIVLSDCRHLNMRELERFPLGLNVMNENYKQALSVICRQLMDDYQRHAERTITHRKATGTITMYDEFYPRRSKPIIDKIDRILARHYGFTDEELDFIVNYDIKYRMGNDSRKKGVQKKDKGSRGLWDDFV
jgi:Eco57I restriction-modification methylase